MSISIEVTPLAVQEGRLVLRLLLVILVLAVLLLSLQQPVAPELTLLLPYQRMFHRLPVPQQVVVRELFTAVPELALGQERGGAWPTPVQLEERMLAPFEPLYLAQGVLRYDWEMKVAGEAVRYFGRPSPAEPPADGPCLLLLIERTDRASDPLHERARARDAEHIRLQDGRLYHYSLWVHAAGARAPDFPVRPAVDGWLQVVQAPGDGPAMR